MSATISPAPPRETPPELRHMPVLLLVLLTIVTGGIYTGVWFLRNRDALNALGSPEKVGKGMAIAIIVLAATSIVALIAEISATADRDPVSASMWKLVCSLLSLTAGIIALVAAFQVRRILRTCFHERQHANIHFSGVLTFFFSTFYLQYKINRLPPPARSEGGTSAW